MSMGHSGNLNILPGGFFDELLAEQETKDMTVPAITQLAGNIYRLDGAEVYEVPSRCRPGVLHLVVRHVGWHCTCPASVTACHHVKRVRVALGES